MTTDLKRFEAELRALAARHGLRLVEAPRWFGFTLTVHLVAAPTPLREKPDERT